MCAPLKGMLSYMGWNFHPIRNYCIHIPKPLLALFQAWCTCMVLTYISLGMIVNLGTTLTAAHSRASSSKKGGLPV